MTDNTTTKEKNEAGFTLIETIIAILILSLSIGALLTLAAGGFFSVRYARNQIVADNLLQESLEYIRNNRDSASQQSIPWATWTATLNVNGSGQPVGGGVARGCFDSVGCWVDPYVTSSNIKECPSGGCPNVVLFPDTGLYGYSGGSYPAGATGTAAAVVTTYARKITAVLTGADQLTVTASISWKNGQATKTVSQSMLLTNWNQ